MKRVIISLCFLLPLANAWSEKMPFDRYQSILDRQMFGPLPPGFDPTKSPGEVQKSSQSEKQLTQEQEKLQSAIHFSVINVTPDGVTAVGFTDNSDPKVPVHYYLKVGEKRNGWEVKEADANKASMTIAKGDIEVSLSLGGNSAKDGGTSKALVGTASGAAFGQRRGSLFRNGVGGSLLARRRERRQAEQAARDKAAAEAAEAEANRQAQAEADKAQQAAERAEQRQQLMAIQEELRRVREEKAKASDGDSDSGGNENN